MSWQSTKQTNTNPFNGTISEEYFQQLTAETVLITYDKGVEVRKYVNPKNVRNEALDIEVGCLAALRLHPRNLDAIEKELKQNAELAKVRRQPKPPPKGPQRKKRERATWLKW